MKICVIVGTLLVLFVDYGLQVGAPPSRPGGSNDDDGEWPFDVFLLGGKITVHPTYGSSTTHVRKDKSDGRKKMSAILTLTRALPCTASVTMKTQVKNAGLWVTGFHNGPKPLNAYVKSIENYVNMLFEYINTTYTCPFGPGTYALENLVVDPTVLPKDTAKTEYIVTHNFKVLNDDALIIDFRVAIE